LGEDHLAGRKKNAAHQGATIVFVDESGFSERPSVQRTWAPRGETPVLRHRFGHWKNLSAIGALAYSPHGRRARFFLSLVPGAVRSEHIIRFLQRLHQYHSGPLIVIWDGVNPHRSLATRSFVEREQHWLTLIRLPAYAPELNPVEGAWSWFKRTVAGNFCPDGQGPLHRALRLARRRLTRRRPLLLGFLHKSGFSLP
jgi:transposase